MNAWCPQMLEDGVWSPGAGVPGSLEACDGCAGTWTWSSVSAPSPVIHWGLSLALLLVLWWMFVYCYNFRSAFLLLHLKILSYYMLIFIYLTSFNVPFDFFSCLYPSKLLLNAHEYAQFLKFVLLISSFISW